MSVARAYAKALFEAARDQKATARDLDDIEIQLGQVLDVLSQSREAKLALLAPAITPKEKVAFLREVSVRAGYGKLLTNFLILLARKERFALLPQIREAFREVSLASEGGILGKLVSADPLETADIETLSKAFWQKLGKKVAFETSTDASLLAGIKVIINGVTYDGTLRSQLQRLRDQLVYGTGAVH